MEDENLLKQKRKKHPTERSRAISKLFFCWLPPFLLKGLKKSINEDDLYKTIGSQKSNYLGDKLDAVWQKELKKDKPSLLRAIFTVFRIELIVYTLFITFAEILKIAQPLLISKLVTYFQTGVAIKRQEIYICATLLIVTTFVQVLTTHHYQLLVMALGMKMRIASCALIYRKALKLSKSSLAETTVGQMVNLLSNDVGRFDFTCQHIHYLFLSPCASFVCMILLYQDVGITGIVGCICLLGFIPVQIYMAKLTSKYRLMTALRTDERVRLMNEIISGIQVIKMYTWERPFSKLIEAIRKKEVDVIRRSAMIKALNLTFNITLTKVAILSCFLVYVLSGNILTAAYAYTITSYYNYIRSLLTLQFTQAMTQFAETKVSAKRIQEFLLYEELDDNNVNPTDVVNKPENEKVAAIRIGLKLKGCSVSWLKSSAEHTLQKVTFEAKSNQLVAVVGPVGGGKSTLLQVILKELIPSEGTVKVFGSISYASQEPWVFASSIRQNILFGQTYNEQKYLEVLKVCALERDLQLFEHGDRTLIGERGCSLSGGQKARINLARAIYKEADIYLLDDPLSAVDTHVGKQLFNRCICGYLRKKCVVLVTHQLQYLNTANFIYLLEDGRITEAGTFENLRNTNTAFTNLLASATEEDKMVRYRTLSKADSIASMEYEEELEIVEKGKEEIGTGSISHRVYRNYLKTGGAWYKTVALAFSFVLTQVLVTCSDLFLTMWVNVEQWRQQPKIIYGRPMKTPNLNITMETTVVSRSEYEMEKYFSKALYKVDPLLIYSLIVIFAVIVAITRSVSSFRYFLTASTRIHKDMFRKIINSPMHFFNTNPSGRILNRISKDMGILDEILPLKVADSAWVGLTVISIALVVGAMNHWIIFLPTSIIFLVCYFMRKVFLVSTRNIKRVEAVTRSPIFTHLSASLQGLTTIRAFKAEKILTQEFDNFQDNYTSAFYTFLTVNRGFGFWLDLQCSFYISLVVLSILFIESASYGGNVGLFLTQAVTMGGMFQWVVRELSELENQMTSVERTQQYRDLPTEQDDIKKEPPKDWPSSGRVKFVNMSLKYSEDTHYVLKNLNFEVESKEKVGIVGRTGAGKSSLIQAIFRLARIEGAVFIDDVDSKTVELKVLRSKLSIIPQEPVLFSGILRKNLDPFDEYTDEVLWDALEEVELKHPVEELQGGMYGKVAEGGTNFSVGQRQLLCLARAIVRNNKILVLDEATANVDPMTDAIIQNTIRKKFAECTVLTIAHRLNTIMDSDKVLVMSGGEAVEFDHPHLLLEKKGVFYSLVKETGNLMAAHLQTIAKDNYYSNKRSRIDINSD